MLSQIALSLLHSRRSALLPFLRDDVLDTYEIELRSIDTLVLKESEPITSHLGTSSIPALMIGGMSSQQACRHPGSAQSEQVNILLRAPSYGMSYAMS